MGVPASTIKRSSVSILLRSQVSLVGIGLAFVLGASPAAADAPDLAPDIEPTAIETYEPVFFNRFSPRTALDMIAQTPGFDIKESESRRGLGQGGANVLINSRRISSKSTSARDALNRITADKVVRIEILDGASLNIPGLTGQVANVVVRRGGLTGNWAWSPEFQEDRTAKLENARVSVSGEFQDLDYTLALESKQFGDGSAGMETVLAADGLTAIEVRDEDQDGNGERREVNLALKHESLAGSFANLTLSGATFNGGGREVSQRTVDDGTEYLRLFSDNNDNVEGEISADYEFGLGPGRLKLIGLQRMNEREPQSQSIATYFGVQADTGSRFGSVNESGETIARAEYGWIDSGDNDWQISLEGAFNYLDTTSDLSTLSGGSFVDVPLTNATTRIEERRTEAALVHGRRLTENVVFQGSAGVEYSELSQSGAVGQVRDFVRPKGFASVSWQPTENWDFALRLERQVGQLDFGDFASSVNLNNEAGQQQVGNPEIVPEQSWDVDLEANGGLGAYGAVRISLYARDISDVNDNILFARVIEDDGSISIDEGPGNLDSAEVYGMDLSGTLELEPLGFAGAKVDWNAGLREASIVDQVTGEERSLNNQTTRYYSFRFRQDVPNTDWAWGFGYRDDRRSPFYRITQLNQRSDSTGNLSVFVQQKDLAGLNARISVDNLLDADDNFQRIAYAGTRLDPIDFIERRSRNRGMEVRLSISGNF